MTLEEDTNNLSRLTAFLRERYNDMAMPINVSPAKNLTEAGHERTEKRLFVQDIEDSINFLIQEASS